MKRTFLTAIFTLMITLPCLAGQYPILKVVDGDTIDIKYNGKKERIRMLCVDTPESVHPERSKNTPMGEKASAYTKHRLAGQSVDLELESKKRGKYGRLLAYVILDGENFNIELVRKGWSKYYTKYGNSKKHHSEFLGAEKEARAQGLNLWAGNVINVGSEDLTCKLVRGNFKSMIFHQPGCRYFDCKNCTKAFPNRHNALKAGYKPCGICKP